MKRDPVKCLLISDSNLAGFAGILANGDEAPQVDAITVPMGQGIGCLFEAGSGVWHDRPEFAFVWMRPEAAIGAFRRLLECGNTDPGEIESEVDRFCTYLVNASANVRALFAATWSVPAGDCVRGCNDMKPGSGVAGTLMRMNLRMAENLEAAGGIHLMDAQRWLSAAGGNARSPKLWYMAKVAWSNPVLFEAAADLKANVRAVLGLSKKLLVVDLDNTLWGGTVGDAGWERLRLGGHDHVGEAFVDFQLGLRALKNRGVLLGIVSKNEESTALEAIRKHPSMALRLEDFAGYRINWRDKAANLADLTADLNLGPDSVVFIDDSPVERARVKEALPDVTVPEWPKDPALFKTTLLSLRYFHSAGLTAEDGLRTQSYVAERSRKALRQKVGSLDEWLETLETKVTVEGLNKSNIQRAAQLFNKTNQMNLSTRRMTEAEIAAEFSKDSNRIWTFQVSDKFGDYGLTGILSLRLADGVGEIVDFILSCRVMGRKIEQAMLATAIDCAVSASLREVVACYLPTAKNAPCMEFFRNSGFEQIGNNRFRWITEKRYPAPKCITIGRP